MEPFELLKPDHDPSGVWVCDNCRLVCRDEDRAAKCCTPVPCRYCGKPTDRKFDNNGYGSAWHDECERADRARRDMECMERAAKLETWQGLVWAPGVMWRDGYFESVADYVDYLANYAEPGDWPEWVHVATERPAVSLDVVSILETVCDDGYEDMADDLRGVDELSKAVDAFNAANAKVKVYDADLKRVVRVPKRSATFAEEVGAETNEGMTP